MKKVKKELTVGQILGNKVWPLIIWYNDKRNKYIEYSDGDWVKLEYDAEGNQIYFENSDGNILDNRPKVELSLKEIADKFGINVNQLRVKE